MASRNVLWEPLGHSLVPGHGRALGPAGVRRLGRVGPSRRALAASHRSSRSLFCSFRAASGGTSESGCVYVREPLRSRKGPTSQKAPSSIAVYSTPRLRKSPAGRRCRRHAISPARPSQSRPPAARSPRGAAPARDLVAGCPRTRIPPRYSPCPRFLLGRGELRLLLGRGPRAEAPAAPRGVPGRGPRNPRVGALRPRFPRPHRRRQAAQRRRCSVVYEHGARRAPTDQ